MAQDIELTNLNTQLEVIKNKFEIFRSKDRYDEFEKIEAAQNRLEGYLSSVKKRYEKYKKHFNPSRSTAIIDMLLDKLSQCCDEDMADDVDKMLSQHVLNIATESKKSDEEEQVKRRKKKRQSYEYQK
jgi:hypothetical protein